MRRRSPGRTNWHSYPRDTTAFSPILAKRTGTPNLMSHRDLILKRRKIFIRFEEPSVIGHQRSAKAETNCPTDLIDSSGFSRNSGKQTARSNSLTRQEIILKILKRLIRFEEPSMIGRQRSAKTKTNCPTHVFESKLLTSILVKRTARPKSLKLMEMILKMLKQLIRCQQQIDGTVVLHGPPGILTDPKVCNRRIFNVLDAFFGLRIAGFKGGEPKPPKLNVFSCMLQKTAASWNKGKRPINEWDPGHGLGNRAEVERTAGTLKLAWLWAGAGERKDGERLRTKPKCCRKQAGCKCDRRAINGLTPVCS
jgi:hypothetical protein